MPRLARGLPQKQDGIKIVTSIPSSGDGKAGDIRLLAKSSVEGAVLYVKSGNKWFPFQSGLDTSTPPKKLFETDGYQVLDSGLIIQWGTTSDSSATPTITFPIAFPSACFQVMGTSGGSGGNTNVDTYTITATNFVMRHGSGERPSYWMAIGH